MMEQKNLTKQKGASFTSLLLIVVLLVFSLNFVVRIASMQWDDRVLVSILDDLPEGFTGTPTEAQVLKLIRNRLDMNRLRGISIDQLVIKKQKNKVDLVWEYERRDNVMWNVDILLTFKHEYSY